MPDFRFPSLAHGGDYNPEQWLDSPEVLKADIRLMREAGCNLFSVGIFAWAALEPQEGVYNFEWLKNVLDSLHEAGISVLLATPSAARPAWMSVKYESVSRVEHGMRNRHGGRENHCFTSPEYRGFVTRMNTRLAQAFGSHPAVVGWHISNEYCGECHCELCQNAFREWLKKRYETLDNLNKAWWTAFWSKTFTDWNQIRSPEPHGETALSGLTLDWRRFVSDQTLDFVKCEVEPIKRITPNLPVAINTMNMFYGLDYSSFEGVVDLMGFDSYPLWGGEPDYSVALKTAFSCDMVRGYLRKPWSLMECTPSQVNWTNVCKLKRPGLHMMSSVQALAHGSDTVMMFQWRKSRGGPEKFHGAVVGHDMTNQTRVFKEVKQVGELLANLKDITNAETKAEVCVIYDQQNRWALDGAEGPRRNKDHDGLIFNHYEALVKQGVNVDVINMDRPLDAYKVVSAPYLYMVRPGVAERLTEFVKRGGILVLTAFCGIVNESDLCFLGGAPGPLRELAGVWAEETDALYDGDSNSIVIRASDELDMRGEYKCGFLADILKTEGAKKVGVYGGDYCKDTPALTVNRVGAGETWYIASRPEQKFLDEFYACVLNKASVERIVHPLPAGVLAAQRLKGSDKFAFIMNFSQKPTVVDLPSGVDMHTGERVFGARMLPANGFHVIKRD